MNPDDFDRLTAGWNESQFDALGKFALDQYGGVDDVVSAWVDEFPYQMRRPVLHAALLMLVSDFCEGPGVLRDVVQILLDDRDYIMPINLWSARGEQLAPDCMRCETRCRARQKACFGHFCRFGLYGQPYAQPEEFPYGLQALIALLFTRKLANWGLLHDSRSLWVELFMARHARLGVSLNGPLRRMRDLLPDLIPVAG